MRMKTIKIDRILNKRLKMKIMSNKEKMNHRKMERMLFLNQTVMNRKKKTNMKINKNRMTEM